MARRKSNATKELTGGKYVREPGLLAPPAMSDSPPRGELTPAERKIYKIIAGQLRDLGMLRQVDTWKLMDYCVAHVTAREARKKLYEDGLIVPGSNGTEKKNVAFQIWRDAVTIKRQLAKELGMSPAAAQYMEPVASESGDKLWAELMQHAVAQDDG